MNKKRIRNVCLTILLIVAVGVGLFQHSGIDWTKSPTKKPVQAETKVEITDLSNAFEIILENSSKKFSKGYPIDTSFLHWISKSFGEDVVMDIAYRLHEGDVNENLWYEYTKNSMHVLWLKYCKDLGFSTYQLENVHWKECASEDVVVIDISGDINLADDWYTMETLVERPNGIYDCISPEVVKELQSADISVINNEFVFSDGGDEQTDKAYTFRSKTENVSMLEAFGADIANLANNHTFDYRASGLVDTLNTLENYGIVTIGAGVNLEDAKTIQYYVANGRKIAFVSATDVERYYEYTKQATETTPGVLKTIDPTLFEQVIAEAKENSDYVIVNVHWGHEGSYKPIALQTQMAKGYIKAGADVVIGGHPHRVQGIEYINNVPVCYSLGNFWFSTGTLYTTIAQIQIDSEGELNLRMIPCIQQNLTTSMLSGADADTFYKFMADISDSIAIDKDGFVYNTSNGRNSHMLNSGNYESEKQYATYNGSFDLEGRPINIVGNLR